MKFTRFDWGSLFGIMVMIAFSCIHEIGLEWWLEMILCIGSATVIGAYLKEWVHNRTPE